ncbi:ABC transporter ATP-binding protein [Miniphocaeibacter halophilus]|uniref:ABC transporter ATP-binding protein n=1 Tax=Miniphocaeibacter halophilus TaxID=2931922 RepID=A0AC61MRR4_9FIRM|nr:ABC transporter ATP-binding protein [Miniphocaeibacter halophilus]QQK07275.1 ABC transporter ATP-binding protein [Miniphocaeibacter halophilus]
MKLVFSYLKKYKAFLILCFICSFGFIFTEIGIPTLFADGISNNFKNGNTQYILLLAIKMYGFAFIGLILLLILAYSSNRMTSKIVRDIRNELFSHIQTFSREKYEDFNISRLLTNIVNDCFIIMQFLIVIIRLGFIAPMMIISSFIMIYRKSPTIAIVTLAIVPILLVGVFLINKITRPISIKQQKKLDNINLNMRESLTGLRVIRAFNRQDFQSKRFGKINEEYGGFSKKLFQLMALIPPLFTVIFSIIMITVVYLGSNYVNQGTLDYGALAAFIEYVFHALFSFLMLANVLIMYPRFSVAVNRINEVLNTQTNITSKEINVETPIKGHIEFKNVSFAYADSSKENVLEDINLSIEPGETVAFIGSTGSGKSTLVRLIPRIFDVTKGSILVDGKDIRDYDLDYLRSKISFVPQKAILFSGTIKNNLLFGNRNASDEELNRAIDIAQAKDFVNSKKDGIYAQLSEGGTNLSGGQKQRLCIARALTRDVPIYIFDDSFSALDYKTDSVLRNRLKEEIKDSTFLIVAQRVATIMEADRIFVVNNGKIVGHGTHKELLKNNPIYREIAESQLSKEELAYE